LAGTAGATLTTGGLVTGAGEVVIAGGGLSTAGSALSATKNLSNENYVGIGLNAVSAAGGRAAQSFGLQAMNHLSGPQQAVIGGKISIWEQMVRLSTMIATQESAEQ